MIEFIKNNKASVIIGFIGILLIILFIYLLDNERTLINILSVVGTVITTVALIITLIQLYSLKHISEITTSTIYQTVQTLMYRASLGDVARAKKIIDEIIEFTNNEKFEIAKLKARDLKFHIINFLEEEKFRDLLSTEKKIPIGITNLIDVNIMNYANDFIKKSDFVKFVETLEKLSSILHKFEHFLKYNKD